MRIPTTRHALVVLLAVLAIPAAAAAPASASGAATRCHSLPLETPPAHADVDGDGNPEVRAGSITDVTLCLGSSVYLTDQPSYESEQCGGFGSCMVYRVHLGLSGVADPGVSLCYSVDGVPTCVDTTAFGVSFDVLAPREMCIGYDLRGGFPCDGRVFTLG